MTEKTYERNTIVTPIVDGKGDNEEQRLIKAYKEYEEHIRGIAEIIYMEMPLRYQDEWLKRIMDEGIWQPETEEILREQEQ
jgi:hypothetical protein